MTVTFSKKQIEVIKYLLESANKSCPDNDSQFRGYISTGLESLISDKEYILPTEK